MCNCTWARFQVHRGWDRPLKPSLFLERLHQQGNQQRGCLSHQFSAVFFGSWTQRLPIFPISFCSLKAYFVLIWKWPYKRGRDREKEQILSTLEKKIATKPTVQIGHIAQIKFSGSKIISSSSYPSIPLPVPPTIVSNEERKQNWISSFLLQRFTLWSKATNRVPMENSKCKETPEHPTWDEVPLPH